MKSLDIKKRQFEKHKQRRSLNSALSLKKILQVSSASKASNEFAPIYLSVVELIKQYQIDSNLEADDRRTKLTRLILERHVGLLNALVKDADSWKKTKEYVTKKIEEQLAAYTSSDSKTAKADVKAVTDEINDAITQALIEHNKSQKAESEKALTRKIRKNSSLTIVVPLDEAVVKEKTSKFMQSKEYKSFLHELKKDFNGFISDYDTNKKLFAEKHSTAAKISKGSKNVKLTNIFHKLMDLVHTKSKKKKGEKDKKGLLSGIDIKQTIVKMSTGIGAAFECSGKIALRAFSKTGEVFKSAKNIMTNLTQTAINATAKHFKGILGKIKGPICAAFAFLIIFPIKLLVKAIMFPITMLMKLISVTAKLIIAPIKLLALGPLKLIKKVGSFTTGLLMSMVSFLNKRTFIAAFKAFLVGGGAYTLGFAVGLLWKYAKPYYDKFINIIKFIKTFLTDHNGKIEQMKQYVDDMFSREERFEEGTLSYSIHKMILSAYDVFDGLCQYFGKNLTDMSSFIKDVFSPENIIEKFPIALNIIEYMKDGSFKSFCQTMLFIRRVTKSPIALAFRKAGLLGMLIGYGIAAVAQSLRGGFSFWTRDDKGGITLAKAYRNSDTRRSDKTLRENFGFNDEQIDKYNMIFNNVADEYDDIDKLKKELNDIYGNCKKTHTKLSDYPEFIRQIRTSYVLGKEYPEVLNLAVNFADFECDKQFMILDALLQIRLNKATAINEILIVGNGDLLKELLTKFEDDEIKSLYSTTVNGTKEHPRKSTAFENTIREIKSLGTNENDIFKLQGIIIKNGIVTTSEILEVNPDGTYKNERGFWSYDDVALAAEKAGISMEERDTEYAGGKYVYFEKPLTLTELMSLKTALIELRNERLRNRYLKSLEVVNAEQRKKFLIIKRFNDFFKSEDVRNFTELMIDDKLKTIIHNVLDENIGSNSAASKTNDNTSAATTKEELDTARKLTDEVEKQSKLLLAEYVENPLYDTLLVIEDYNRRTT